MRNLLKKEKEVRSITSATAIFFLKVLIGLLILGVVIWLGSTGGPWIVAKVKYLIAYGAVGYIIAGAIGSGMTLLTSAIIEARSSTKATEPEPKVRRSRTNAEEQ